MPRTMTGHGTSGASVSTFRQRPASQNRTRESRWADGFADSLTSVIEELQRSNARDDHAKCDQTADLFRLSKKQHPNNGRSGHADPRPDRIGRAYWQCAKTKREQS